MIHQINFQSFFADLKSRLAQPLPGETAQYKMAPARRLTLTDFYESGNSNYFAEKKSGTRMTRI
jgi:hypothetical protein